jgi:hypothetical protein
MNKQQKLEKLNFLIKEFEAIIVTEIKRDQSIDSITEQARSIVKNNSDLNRVDILRLETLINEMEDLNESI